MNPEGGEPHAKRVAAAAAAIRRDLIASGRTSPGEAILGRAADIVASYPDSWRRYDAQPDDWDGRSAVAVLLTWRKLSADLAAPTTAAA